MIGLVQVGRQAMADRYAYLPLLGIFIMICWGIADYAAGEASSRGFLARGQLCGHSGVSGHRPSSDWILGRQRYFVDAHDRSHCSELRCTG